MRITRRNLLTAAATGAVAGSLGKPGPARAAMTARMTFGPALPVYSLTFIALE